MLAASDNSLPSIGKRKRMNVLFVNSAQARCSIHESGAMVAACLRDSDKYDFHHATIDELDEAALKQGRFAWRRGVNRPALPQIDVSVFNWHIVTMPLPDQLIAGLPGVKLAIVLEAAPEDPLALTPVKAFDGYIVLDPTLPSSEKVFGFPRPLNPLPFTKRTQPTQRPRIGSFGFPTPGKGFELVVEAVNREFDEADIRINVPRGDYTSSTAVIHDEDYVDYLRRSVTAVAKPGINVEFTTHFLTPREVVEWCGSNDLNCFMYTREQPGLSATTDQAIVSGQPLIAIGNPTFRHVAEYIPSYPHQSLKEAMQSSVPAVLEMQWAWSPQVFREQFEDLLARLSKSGNKVAEPGPSKGETSRPLVIVAEVDRAGSSDMLTYRARVTAALDRSGQYQARVADATSLSGLISELLRNRPSIVLLMGREGAAAAEWAEIIRAAVPQVRVIEAFWENPGAPRTDAFRLQPIIPFHTTFVPRLADPAVLLLGFSADRAALVRALRTIARDDAAARVLVAAQPADVEPLRAFLDTELGLPKKSVQGTASAVDRNPYLRANSLDELLSWDGVDFVRCAYVTILGRQPDPDGEIYYSRRIAEGRPKMEMLWQLRRSREGANHDPGIAGLDRALKRAAWERKSIIGRLARALYQSLGSGKVAASPAKTRIPELKDLWVETTTLPSSAPEVIKFMAENRAIIAQDDDRAHEEIRDLLSLAYVTERQILISADRPVRPFADLTPKLGEMSLVDGDRLGSASRVGTVLDYGEWAFAARFHDHVRERPAGAASGRLTGMRAVQDMALAGLCDLRPSGFVHAAATHLLGHVPAPLQVSEGEALLVSGASRGDVISQLEMRLAVSRLDDTASGVDPATAWLFLAELATLTELGDREFIAAAYNWILGRKPDPGEWRHHLAALSQGGDRIAWFAGILDSDEHAARARHRRSSAEIVLDQQFETGRAAIVWIAWLLELSDKDFRSEVGALYVRLGLRRPRSAGSGTRTRRLQLLFDLALSDPSARKTMALAIFEDAHNRSIRLFQAALGGLLDLDDREFVGVLYRVVLERDPDPEKFSHLVNLLRSGGSRAFALTSMLASKERPSLSGAAANLSKFPLLLGRHPLLHLAISWLEGLLSTSSANFLDEVKRVSSLTGTATKGLGRDDAASRAEILLAMAAETRAAAGADDIAATRVRLWHVWTSLISAGHLGPVQALEELPDVGAASAARSSAEPSQDSFPVPPNWINRQEGPRPPLNLFGEMPPSRLMSGVRPSVAPPASVYLLGGEGQGSAAIVSMIETCWPSNHLPLTPVEWNSATRRLEIKSACTELKQSIGAAVDGCLLISGSLADDEPLGLVGAISEARTRGWSVVALTDDSSAVVTLQDPDNGAVSGMALYWQSLLLVDRVVATSKIAERQLRNFLASELAYDDPSLITTIPIMPGIGLRRAAQETAFVHRLADALPALVRGPQEFVGTVFYHAGSAASEQIRSLPQYLRDLGVAAQEMDRDSAVLPFPSSERPAWIIADFETDVSELRRLRAAAAALSAKTLFLGPIPVTAPGLVEELLHWDLVASSRFEDFEELSDSLRATTLRVIDAESRFVYLDHPCEHGLTTTPRELASSEEKFRLGIALHPKRSAEQAELWEALNGTSHPGPGTNPGIEWIDLSAAPIRSGRADLDAVVDRALNLDLLIVSGPAGYVLDVVDRVTLRGTPCLVDSALSLPPLPGVLQASFEEIRDLTAAVMANIDFFRSGLKKAAETRRKSSPQERAGKLLELMATQGHPSLPAAKRKSSLQVEHHPNQPLLSLCISTYNRGGWVAKNLEHIFRQIRGLDLPIEVLLVDNCSSDDTPQVASRFASEKSFRYVRNPRNVGMLGNLAVTAQHSRGKFVWILGDDDFTCEGVIARVCELLQSEEDYDLICFNYGYVSYQDPAEVADGSAVINKFNLLEPAGPDRAGLVGELASLSENFYTAIYSHVYRRRHAIRAYCQNTNGRPFSSLLTCVPTSAYTLSQMASSNAFWFGEPSLVINSNVSWQQYGSLFDLEQLPRVWDLAERAGADPIEVDRRRSSRLWLVELMWREMYDKDTAGNQAYFDPARVLMRLKHLDAIASFVPTLRSIYEEAHHRGERAARAPLDSIFAAWASVPDASKAEKEAS